MLYLYRCVFICVPEIVWNSYKSDMSWHKILSVIIIEAHTKRTETEGEGNALADFDTKSTATDSIKIVTYVVWSLMNEVHSASAKMTPLLPDFCPSDILVTWQQSAPKSEKLKWANNGCKLNKQSGYKEPKMATWFFPAPWQLPFISFCMPHSNSAFKKNYFCP